MGKEGGPLLGQVMGALGLFHSVIDETPSSEIIFLWPDVLNSGIAPCEC